MNYISNTFKYVFKNIHRLIIFVFVPAILFAFFFDLVAFSDLIRSINEGGPISFRLAYQSLSLFAHKYWWVCIIALVLFTFAVGITMSSVDKHMRIGKFSFNFVTRFDEVLFMIVPIMLIGIAFTELFSFICACVITLFGLFIPTVAMPFVCVAIAVIAYVIWSSIIVLALNWIPCMIVQGYSFGEAFGCSVRFVTKKYFKLFSSWIFPLLIVIPILVLAKFYTGNFVYLFNFVCYVFLILYYCVLSMTTFYDVAGYERRDIKRKLF